MNYKNPIFFQPTPIPTLPLLPSASVTGLSHALLGVQQGQNPNIAFLLKLLGLIFPINPPETFRGVYLANNQ